MKRKLAGRGFVVGACLLTFLSTACTPSDPAPPTPSPSPSASAPTETAQEREQRLAYEAAEKSYREFRGEYNRLTAAGGATKLTAKMKATSGGTYQAELLEVLQAFRKAGYRTRGQEKIPSVVHTGYSETSLLLNACEDDRAVRTLNRAGKVVEGGDVLLVKLEVRKVGDSWKVWSGTGSEAKSCDG